MITIKAVDEDDGFEDDGDENDGDEDDGDEDDGDEDDGDEDDGEGEWNSCQVKIESSWLLCKTCLTSVVDAIDNDTVEDD